MRFEDMVTAISVTAILCFSLVRIVTVFLNRHRSSATPPLELGRIDERLARIEHAVEAMSIEVERISEGQRFTTKLMAERVREQS